MRTDKIQLTLLSGYGQLETPICFSCYAHPNIHFSNRFDLRTCSKFYYNKILVYFFASGQHLITAIADAEYGFATTAWWLGEEVTYIELGNIFGYRLLAPCSTNWHTIFPTFACYFIDFFFHA